MRAVIRRGDDGTLPAAAVSLTGHSDIGFVAVLLISILVGPNICQFDPCKVSGAQLPHHSCL